jgi:hypothetical protein
MVDISPDGIKLGKDDLCSKLNEDLLRDGKLLEGMIQKGKGYAMSQAKEKFGELTGLGDGALSDPQDAMDGAADNANTAADAATSMKDKVLGGGIVDGSDISVQTIADCLGGGLPDLGFPDAESPIDLKELGKIMDNVLGAVLGKVLDAIAEALSPLENAIADALDKLQSLIPTDLLDELLNLVQCLEGCPNIDQSKLPTLIDIEEKVSSIGLKITGEIDWESGAWKDVGEITDSMKEQFDNISAAKEDLKGAVGGINDVKLPELPELPAVPRPPNPLEGLSIKDKIESLF